jgi:uncharacterized protein YgbK (DUF1537 family)
MPKWRDKAEMNGHFERLLIVADDLTGALDTAAPFAANGKNVIVVANQAFIGDAMASDADVITVTTRSREIPAEEAARLVATVKAAMPAGIRLFKKVDSRLKGNLEAELEALAFERAIVLPAIPEFGRIVKDGMIDGFGVTTPISVADRLGSVAALCRFPDTTTPEEMRDVAATISADELMVGALSLAKAIAGEDETPLLTYPTKQILMAIGSRDPITLAQLDRLKTARPDVAYFAAPNGSVDAQSSVSRTDAAITVVQAVPAETEISGQEAANALADTVARLATQGDTILLCGGATAEALFDREGIHILRFVGEALPGLPVAEFNGTFYITKSGGFGNDATLLQLALAVTGGEA